MKKYLKLTVYKKIFLVIFSLILGIEAFHAYNDFQYRVEEQKDKLELYQNRSLDSIFELKNKLQEYNGDINDPDFLEWFQNCYKRIHENNFVIVDENLKEINNGDYWEKDMTKLIHIEDNQENGYEILCDMLDREAFEEIYNEIYRQTKNLDHYLNVEINAEFKVTEGYLTASVDYDDILYLKIGDHVFIDKDKSKIQKMIFTDLLSQLYSLNYDEMENVYADYNYKKVRDDLLEELKEIDRFPVIGEGIYQNYIIDNHICNAFITKLSDELYGVSFMISYEGIDYIKKQIISQYPLYVYMLLIAAAVSGMISYMFTKRIRSINNATRFIADNHFDIKLKERPHDELGELSVSINKMSQNLKLTIEKLNEEIQHVKELESLRKDFINQFTHEMKTPLGIINGYSELLDEAENEEEKERYLDIINKETSRINQLIQSMLNLSRLEAGKVEVKKESFDLEDLVTEIIDEYEVLLMKKNIQVKVNVIESMLYADRNLIQTVVHNFLSNAIKHTYEEGKIIVTINHGLSVFNEGDFIEESRLESIWYTFVTHDQEGSGLGLAICRSILELHGFEYGVMNKSHGVEFYFYENIK